MHLIIGQDAIIGNGSDRDGGFSIIGTYDAEKSQVSLFKRYLDLSVSYLGHWDGSQISGNSIIRAAGFLDLGSFEIWPEEDDESIEESMKFSEQASSDLHVTEPYIGCRIV